MKLFVYGLLDNNNKITYVGQTYDPISRLDAHYKKGYCESGKMKILEVYSDKEFEWIQKCISEGFELKNKLINRPSQSDFKAGDIVVNKIGLRRRYRFKDMLTNHVYETLSEASEKLNINTEIIRKLLVDDDYKQKNQFKYECDLKLIEIIGE